ncbi:MAG: hypothetical protein CMO06_15990 [Thalassospira sp.]|nr:hypothetical protein [Thalassospira sp.]MAZ33923.1 hypothetical protein [Thalassospira sp.]MAZ34640.1 hypothetical protein [Thalassospira sp.]
MSVTIYYNSRLPVTSAARVKVLYTGVNCCASVTKAQEVCSLIVNGVTSRSLNNTRTTAVRCFTRPVERKVIRKGQFLRDAVKHVAILAAVAVAEPANELEASLRKHLRPAASITSSLRNAISEVLASTTSRHTARSDLAFGEDNLDHSVSTGPRSFVLPDAPVKVVRSSVVETRNVSCAATISAVSSILHVS